MEPWQMNPQVLGEPVALIWLSENAPEGELWPAADGRSWLCHPKTWAQIRRQRDEVAYQEEGRARVPAEVEIDTDPFTPKEVTVRVTKGPPPCP